MELNEVLYLDLPIYAHNQDKQKKERLQEHVELCKKYYKKIMEQKGLSPILENFIQEYTGIESQEAKEFILKMIEYTILFHDTGKINSAYQRQKMENTSFDENEFTCDQGTKHSLLSSVIYIDYFYYQIEKTNFSKKEKRMMKKLTVINGFVISRHHSDLGRLGDYGFSFEKNGSAFRIMEHLKNDKQRVYKGPFFFQKGGKDTAIVGEAVRGVTRGCSRKQQIFVYTYIRLLYSILVASDYYATSEYTNGIEITQFGDVSEKEELKDAFEKNGLMRKIRAYEKEFYGKNTDFSEVKDINTLRTEMFLDAESVWKKQKDKNVFFLEAPTGSGKSNVAMNLSFQMLRQGQNKIFYVYPFNTLVEQNKEFIYKAFEENDKMMAKVAVVNSVTPIKVEKENPDEEEMTGDYQKALLDRQFLNYPFILTTHVTLFRTLFGHKKDAIFSFLQISNSVIVLDEIQSYRNDIWSEIIIFLKAFAEMMNVKIIIMSATLPDLDYLAIQKNQEEEFAIKLIENRGKYFHNPIFKNRVQLSYELLKEKIDFQGLYEHIMEHKKQGQKILVEFIKKDSAYQFYDMYRLEKDMEVLLLTGDDNQIERECILEKVKAETKRTIILIATQVVEAGVDIDMDLGYKDISKLDSEEQFLGRINRSCKKDGYVYFFDMDSEKRIYQNDIRMEEEFILRKKTMQEILEKKDFQEYYLPVLRALQKQRNESTTEEGLEFFFEENVGNGDFPVVEERMKLIEENNWNISLFLARNIALPDGKKLNGWDCWEEYRQLTTDQKMDYAKRQVKLSEARSKMSYFIYQVKRNSNLSYSDCIGELYAIEKAEKYFDNGKLNKKRLESEVCLFLDW